MRNTQRVQHELKRMRLSYKRISLRFFYKIKKGKGWATFEILGFYTSLSWWMFKDSELSELSASSPYLKMIMGVTSPAVVISDKLVL